MKFGVKQVNRVKPKLFMITKSKNCAVYPFIQYPFIQCPFIQYPVSSMMYFRSVLYLVCWSYICPILPFVLNCSTFLSCITVYVVYKSYYLV